MNSLLTMAHRSLSTIRSPDVSSETAGSADSETFRLHLIGPYVAGFSLTTSLLCTAAMVSNTAWQLTVTSLLSLPTLAAYFLGRRSVGGRHIRSRPLWLVGGLLFQVMLAPLLVEELFNVMLAPFALTLTVAWILFGHRGSYLLITLGSAHWAIAQSAMTDGRLNPVTVPGPMGDVIEVATLILSLVLVPILLQLAADDRHRTAEKTILELLETNRNISKANQLKSQFTARTSHELRTPLSSILVFTDLTLRGTYGPVTPKQEDCLNRVMKSARRVNALVDDILDLSKIEAGKLEIVQKRVLLVELLDQVEMALGPKADEKGLTFTCILSEGMPRCIMGDERRLSQILINLVDNAIKFTEDGHVMVVIELAADSQWQMVVKDSGLGIPPDKLERIFDAFEQESSSNSASNRKGTGLGLAICRHLAQMMEGEIIVNSDLGNGTTFKATFPLTLPEEPAE